MQSTPEKNPQDLVMQSVASERPHKMYACRGPSANREVVFDKSLISDVVLEPRDRSALAERGWRTSSPEMRDRLVRNLMRLKPCSTFSGAGGLETILHFIRWEVNKHLHVPVPALDTTDATDICPYSQCVLRSYNAEYRHCHLRADLTDRLPHDLWQQVERMLPAKTDYDGAKALCYRRIRKVFKDFYALRGDETACAHCLLHDAETEGKGCALQDDVWSLYTRGSCQHPLVLHGAGIPCDDLTAMGGRAGEGGSTQTVHAMFSEERAWRGEDLLLYECAAGWDASTECESLGKQYKAIEGLIHAPLFGDVCYVI